MNHRPIEQLTFEKYSFAELDRRENQLGIVCDGAAWHDFLREIREQGGVLEAIGMWLQRFGKTHNLSNQFTCLECWYNVARLYPVRGEFDHYDLCSPDEFVEKLERIAKGIKS